MTKKNLKSLVRVAQGNENLVSQNYLDTLLKAYTRKNHLRVGEGRIGVLTMVEEDELFEFVEQSHARWSRNPLVFQGAYINIHRDKNGHYQIALRRVELSKWCNVVRLGSAITTELLTAKKVLGVCRK